MGISNTLPDNRLHTIRMMRPASMRGIVPTIDERKDDDRAHVGRNGASGLPGRRVPGGHQNFTGEIAEELVRLVDAGTIRVIDLIILRRTRKATVDAMELSDLGELGPLVQLEAELAELLAADDVAHLAARWNRAASPACSSTRTSGRRRSPRPPAAPAASSSPTAASPSKRSSPRIEADEALERQEPDMKSSTSRTGRRRRRPRRQGRGRRRSRHAGAVAGRQGRSRRRRGHAGPSPVAKAAVVGAAVTPGRRRRI